MILRTPEQVRALEAHFRDGLGLPLYALMEAAGGAVAARVLRERPERVVVVCGKGNNGGDGLVCARRLRDAGVDVEVRLLGRARDYKGDAALAMRALAASPGRPASERAAGRRIEAGRGVVVVDALFGTGFSRPPDREAAAAFRRVNEARARGARVVAVDVPSGLSALTGASFGEHVRADVTATFAPLKVGLLLDPALEAVGELDVAEIGIPADTSEGLGFELETVDLPQLARMHGPRPRAGFKNTFGHLLCVGGAEGKSGAIALTAMAALRAGAGLVTVASHPEVVRRAQAYSPELMGAPLEGEGALTEADWPRLEAALKGKQALVIGPGLEVGQGTRALVLRLLAAGLPTVLDADGLNALGPAPRLGDQVVLTPHPGEAGRLLGSDGKAVQADRLAAARALAERTGATAVLKGAHTLIASAERTRVNLTGSARLGTAGSGDVLAGVIGALLAHRNLPPDHAAALGVALHARCGELDPERATLTAGDLVALLPRALGEAGL